MYSFKNKKNLNTASKELNSLLSGGFNKGSNNWK